ncbi:MAG: signal peptidase II [Alphaproteobacteria bacterium]|nr:signal peptidase II [Alphaproteobacteria bacterium]
MKKGLITALIVIIFDQITKHFVLHFFMNTPMPYKVNDFFNLVLAWNRGVSFSMFHSNSSITPWILIFVSLSICFMIFSWMKKETNHKITTCFGLILGGALGNITDRVLYTAVIDFIDIHYKNHHWPAFNIADSAICIGACIILIHSLFFTKNKENKD